MDAKTTAEEASIAVAVIRADGRREELGIVSYWHKNPLKRALWKLRNRDR